MEEQNVQNSPNNPNTQNLVKEIAHPLYQAKGWMQLLGVVMIIEGILAALTVVGIIFAWLPIWLGVLLFKAAGAADSAMFTGEKSRLIESLRNVKTFFIINGVMMLLIVALFGAIFFLGGMAAFMGM